MKTFGLPGLAHLVPEVKIGGLLGHYYKLDSKIIFTVYWHRLKILLTKKSETPIKANPVNIPTVPPKIPTRDSRFKRTYSLVAIFELDIRVLDSFTDSLYSKSKLNAKPG